MRRLFAATVVAAMLAAACSSSGGDSAGSASADQPERIVSLSPTATEILFAIGAGDQVVAVDDQSNFPPEAPTTDLSGFEPNLEAITELDPDLVVASDDLGGLVDGMEAVDVSVILQPAAVTLDDTYEQIAELGEVTGNAEEAAELSASMQAEIDEITEQVGDAGAGLSYYHELDDLFFSATSGTFIGQIYGLLGLENIADAADDGSGFPQLSQELIIESDPDLIFLADTVCCGQDAATVAARPGWESIAAVTDGGVVELNDDVASRWGPRVVDFLQVVADAVTARAAS